MDSESMERERGLSRPVAPMPELLAPAGDEASLAAALEAGADAVYFGLDEGFNARARAANFTLEGLAGTVERIHAAGARAYLTLNTLVFEPELRHVERVIRGAAHAGVDALIVQDPAVCLLARAIAPALEIHASTQMTVSTARAAEFATRLGATRVVAPRELSVAEIDAFARESGALLEVFVHGALCVSWSGQCLTSEVWSGRSANRGQCAQSCRLPYDLIVDGEHRPLGDVKYLLSPKDLAGARAVPQLARSGVASLKIEGRQKGPAYVYSATRGYRRLLDALAAGASPQEAAASFERDLAAMTFAYTRGFSDGFLGGSDHQTLVEGRFPKHRGALLGRVERVEGEAVFVAVDARRPWTGALAGGSRGEPRGTPRALDALADFGGDPSAATGPRTAPLEPRAGMGVVFERGEPEDSNEPGGPIFAAWRRGASLVLRFGKPGPDLARVRRGDQVWVTSDPEVSRAAERAVAAPPRRRAIDVEIAVDGRLGMPLRAAARLAAEPATSVVASSANPLEAARGQGLDAALLEAKLGALGDSGYVCVRLDAAALAPGLHVPVSELKTLRRQLVARLDEARAAAATKIPMRQIREDSAIESVASGLAASEETAGPTASVVVPLCRDDAQLAAALDAGCREIELDYMELVGLARAVERTRAAGARAVVATLRVDKPLEESFLDAALALAHDGLLVRHLSALAVATNASRRASRPSRLLGDFSLNVANSLTARWLLSCGLDGFTPSVDLDEDQLRALLGAAPASRATIALYHRVAAFHTEHCVYAHLLSEGRDHRTCGRPCERHRVSLREALKGGPDLEHPVIVDAACRNTVFDGRVQTVAPLVPELIARGVRRFRVELLREGRDDARVVIDAATRLIAGEISPREFSAATGARPRVGLMERAAVAGGASMP
jgi:putative protease